MGFMNLSKTLTVCIIVSLMVGLGARPSHCQEERLKLTGSAFSYFGNLPLRYTCAGLNVSPPLGWVNVPTGCKSLALVLINSDDSTVHWLVWNIDPEKKVLEEGVDPSTFGAVTGKNDLGTSRYEGPCPTDGKAKYSLVLYALRDTIPLAAGSDKRLFYNAVNNLVIEEFTFVFFSGTPREH